MDRLRIEHVPVTVVERRWVAYNLDAGHVLAIWLFGGRTLELSLHGFEHRDLLIPMVRASIAQLLECPALAPEPDDGPCALVFPAMGGNPG